MELRQLRYLIALAESGSFTGAAELVRIAQPALSRQIKKLEHEFGLPLVDRTTRRVSLTPAGREVIAAARRVFAELEELRGALDQTVALLHGTVTIGVTQTPGPVNVPKLLADFQRQHPGVELVVREGLSLDLATQLREDRIELGLVSAIGSRDRDQLEMHRVRAEPLAVLVAATHRLARRQEIRLSELCEERFVSFPAGATIRESVEHAAAESGFVPRASIESSDVDRIVALVAEGLGVAVLPDSDARRGGPQTVTVKLCEPTLRYEVFVAWRARRQLGPAASEMRATVMSGARDEDGVLSASDPVDTG